MEVFADDGIVTESEFFDKLNAFDWDALHGQRVLVVGCGSTIFPPWAFLAVASKLVAHGAKVIKYGNEHSSLTVYRKPRREADVSSQQ